MPGGDGQDLHDDDAVPKKPADHEAKRRQRGTGLRVRPALQDLGDYVIE
jgi:hypothetical protein